MALNRIKRINFLTNQIKLSVLKTTCQSCNHLSLPFESYTAIITSAFVLYKIYKYSIFICLYNFFKQIFQMNNNQWARCSQSYFFLKQIIIVIGLESSQLAAYVLRKLKQTSTRLKKIHFFWWQKIIYRGILSVITVLGKFCQCKLNKFI